ncbi:hypothetical protein [Streptomyces alanosinicus]|uniref:Uncharacterized protein n=1 Tax=Streptomyces alanosinicus TaxID=68171 RepID=A0A918YGK1_9ACTN|nr:hypothetical protein [Streptomyces alanosinicus]GHE02945.1 hypothetical protein GCM10010339_28270 [Streptomyces alanosinicus]
MAEGDGVACREIRVRLDGTASERDVAALKKWLEREPPLEMRVHEGLLQIHERPRTDGGGAPMGVGMDIVLALVGAGAKTIFDEVLSQVKQAVEAWSNNRREVEDGDPPTGSVGPVHPDAR